AFTSWSDVRGSVIQLLVNILVLIVVGAATLKAQRAIWQRVGLRRDRRRRAGGES
ncbi:DUF389 domain-containing protein, partial [Streptomyces sp. SID8455]|nr:DUF389 domain-containing protein [Streptomyces sp. SID8455]